MPSFSRSTRSRLRSRSLSSFTLVELLTVMAIIAILSALVLMAGQAVINKAARGRALSEIQAISAALERYKTDNGSYVTVANPIQGPPYPLDPTDPSSGYQNASQALYLALAGHASYTDVPAAGVVSYISFKANQLGDPTGNTYFKDPFGYPYGYSVGAPNPGGNVQANPPYNGDGFFDLWSTAGKTKDNISTNTWVTNWK